MRSVLRAHLAAYGFFLALAILITWPLAAHLGADFAGYPFGDAHEMTRNIWWIGHALRTGQPVIFQPLLAYPDGLDGVILWSNPLQFFPAWLFALVISPVAAYNLSALLTLALNGWALFWLTRRLTGGTQAALVSGAFFLAAPVIQGHLAGGHGGLLVQWPLPFLVWSLLRLTRDAHSSRRSLALVSIWVFITPLGHTLQLIYAVFPLVGLFAFRTILRRDGRALGRLVLAVGAGALLLALFLLPTWSSVFGTRAYTGEGGGVTFSADLLAPLTPSFNHPLFGQLDYTHRVLGTNSVEGSAYVGIVAGLLVLIALWTSRRQPSVTNGPAASPRFWLALAAMAFILSLGPLLKILDRPVTVTIDGYPTHVALPFAALFDLPGFSLARTPGRFNFLLALAIAALAGWGAHALLARIGRPALRTSAVVILIALGLFEYQSFWPLPSYSASIPQPVLDLADQPEVRAVFDVPWDNVLAAKDAMWLQTGHRRPLLAGQITRRTPVSPAKLSILQATFDPVLLREAGADRVIVHRAYDPGDRLLERARRQLGDPVFADDRLALFAIPVTGAAPALTTLLPASGSYLNQADGYIYTPHPAWLRLSARAGADGRAVRLLLDDQIIFRSNAPDGVNSRLFLPLATPGYHMLSFLAHPLCPSQPVAPLECRWLGLKEAALAELPPGTASFAPVRLDSGVALLSAYLPLETTASVLEIGLYWQFSAGLTGQQVRFLHVIDSAGAQVAGDDRPLGTLPSGSQLVDTVTLSLPDDLPASAYRVQVGWYTYPDLQRLAVLDDVRGASDGLILLGEFRRLER